MFASHNQFHLFGFSDLVNLLGSSPSKALHLRCGGLGKSSKNKLYLLSFRFRIGFIIFKFDRALTFYYHSLDISFLNCHNMLITTKLKTDVARLIDSSVLDKTAHAFNATH